MNLPAKASSIAELAAYFQPPALHDCWNRIGVMGDRSCSELSTVMHCYDCPVYASAGDSLLEREPPQNYLNEWIDILTETPHDQADIESDGAIVRTADAISVIIFRLGNERLALPVRVLQEVTPPCIVQPVPHRSDALFLGLANIRGETLLCVSLSHLLNVEPADEEPSNSMSGKRMMVAGQGDDKWVFAVDEVHGVFRFHLNEIRDAPIVISKAAEAYTQGIVHWQGQKVNYIDSELLFYTMNHKIL
jgi:chemotaxis-related protein WspD